MKRKVLIGIIGITLFTGAILLNLNKNENASMKEANIEAIDEAKAGMQCMVCSDANWACVMDGIHFGWQCDAKIRIEEVK